MDRTTENLLTWGALGAGMALILSDHRRLGVAIAAVAPTVVMIKHPRGTRKALRAIPRSMKECGDATGKAVGRFGRQVGRTARGAGKGLSWLAS